MTLKTFSVRSIMLHDFSVEQIALVKRYQFELTVIVAAYDRHVAEVFSEIEERSRYGIKTNPKALIAFLHQPFEQLMLDLCSFEMKPHQVKEILNILNNYDR